MPSHSDLKRCFAVLVAASLPVLTASCLNPELVNQSSGNLYPAAPGDEPFLLVRVINDTQAELDIPIIHDDGTGPQPFIFRGINPGDKGQGVLLDWPVTRVNVGSLDSPFLPTIIAALPDGVTVTIAPNLLPAQASVDFNRGDTLVYRFVGDARNPAAIGVTLARIDGTTQQGPFARADTFRTVRQILQLGTVSGGIGDLGTGSLAGTNQ